jgi:hypothetical protein
MQIMYALQAERCVSNLSKSSYADYMHQTLSWPPVSPTTTNIDTLVIPPVPEILNKADYSDVPYWNESDWTNYSE